MTEIRLKEFGTTYATRQRAAAVVEKIQAAGANAKSIEVSFDGVKAASPSFLDELFGGLSNLADQVDVTCVDEAFVELVARVIERRGLGRRFRVLATA